MFEKIIFCRAQLYYVFLFWFKIFKDQLTDYLFQETQDNCFDLSVQKAALPWKNLLHAALPSAVVRDAEVECFNQGRISSKCYLLKKHKVPPITHLKRVLYWTSFTVADL